ncbi:hypothetical protein OG275_05275 [Streptomyces niveus]|uniref:hypothetical protein n=1 Tax=Streptomyces niveus TaxID=193462 RepID=UPI002E30CD80|nr:hypothetical protein [Streptomyces niveus]
MARVTPRAAAGPGVVDGSDFAAIHRVRNALFGVWANAAFLAAEGRTDTELARYLSRWALLSETDAAAAVGSLRATGTALYVLAYFRGRRLLTTWLATRTGRSAYAACSPNNCSRPTWRSPTAGRRNRRQASHPSPATA